MLTAGCIERNLDPFEDSAGFYSVYGALDAESRNNYVRIQNTHLPVLDDAHQQFDGTVEFENLNNGSVQVLENTTVDFSGYITHNFLVDQELIPKNSYRLKVNRPDGASVSSTATIPGLTELSVIPKENASCSQQIEFRFKNVVYPERIILEVGITRGGTVEWSGYAAGPKPVYRDGVDEMVLNVTPRNLLLLFYPPSGVSAACNRTDSIYIRYRHLGPEWQILNEWAQFPGDHSTWNDVANGSGFLGAFREDKLQITLRN